MHVPLTLRHPVTPVYCNGGQSESGDRPAQKHLVYELEIRRQATEGSDPDLVARLGAAVFQPVDVTPAVLGETGAATEFLLKAVRGLVDTICVLEGTQPSASLLDTV
ncbi:uncharacterized protein LOC126302691 [Schistocerca gregaria]|uniref:uncharacterized protein LOC126302691 n=1 Tax=Schistocerca gregaria TaxID=7010 RepID=UPI00211DBD4B|nr:uncharacterized protein LOC126302691 [Schistocerca gregaria]